MIEHPKVCSCGWSISSNKHSTLRGSSQLLSTGLACVKNILTPRRWLWLIMFHLIALNCLGTDLSFVGSGSYNVVGNTVVLQANEILDRKSTPLNSSHLGNSQTLF